MQLCYTRIPQSWSPGHFTVRDQAPPSSEGGGTRIQVFLCSWSAPWSLVPTSNLHPNPEKQKQGSPILHLLAQGAVVQHANMNTLSLSMGTGYGLFCVLRLGHRGCWYKTHGVTHRLLWYLKGSICLPPQLSIMQLWYCDHFDQSEEVLFSPMEFQKGKQPEITYWQNG